MSHISPGLYRHYKGHIYLVLGESKHTETGEIFVNYVGLQDNLLVYWSRPKKMFLEMVSSLPRFSFLEPVDFSLITEGLSSILRKYSI